MWAIVTQNFETVVQTCELRNWREALAVVLTYAAGDEFHRLCGQTTRLLIYYCDMTFTVTDIHCDCTLEQCN